jgi:endoglycosylceramidase
VGVFVLVNFETIFKLPRSYRNSSFVFFLTPMFVVVALLAHSASALPRIHVSDDSYMVDEVGRIRIFHGFNDVGSSKGSGFTPGGPQYLAKHVSNPANGRILSDLGFNAVRLPMMWSGGMPAPDTFDDDYFNASLDTIEQLSNNGIYSLLDMHQDVLSSKFGGYDGAPRWLVNRSIANHQYPWPIKKLSSWSEGYVTEAVGQAFQDIYDNKHGGLDAWAAFWEHAALRFREHTGVLGYEVDHCCCNTRRMFSC